MVQFRLLDDISGDTLKRIAGFYLSAGWLAPGEDDTFLVPAFRGAFLAAGAFDGDLIVGSARVLSDGCSDAYIQDVVVDPAYRGQGIGRGLIGLLTEELKKHGIDWIGLVGEPGTEAFYRKLGWSPKPGYLLWQYKKL